MVRGLQGLATSPWLSHLSSLPKAIRAERQASHRTDSSLGPFLMCVGVTEDLVREQVLIQQV